jgi:putative DNA primase/helicase
LRFAREKGQDLRFAPETGEYFICDEKTKRWTVDDELQHVEMLKEFQNKVGNEAYAMIMKTGAGKEEPEKLRAKATRVASTLSSTAKPLAITSALQSSIAIRIDQFDQNLLAINTPNGIVDLRTGEMRPTRREDFVTKTTVVGPIKMETPVFDKFQREIMGELLPPSACACAACKSSDGKPDEVRQALHLADVQAQVDYMNRLYGYCLSGDVSEHILVIQWGGGGNGKGLINNLADTDIWGLEPIGYSCEVPAEALISKDYSRHPTELMPLRHSRLAISRELPKGRLNENRVKRLSGEDMLQARLMRQDFLYFKPTHKLICFGQNKPNLYNSGEAAWKRRVHLVAFLQKVDSVADPAKNVLQANLKLHDELKLEAAGILWKFIQGCVDCLRSGLRPPPTVVDASSDYLVQQDDMQVWLDEHCNLKTNATSQGKLLWADFISWCDANHCPAGYRADFYDRLRNAGITVRDTDYARAIAFGIELLDPSVVDEAERLARAKAAADARKCERKRRAAEAKSKLKGGPRS